MSEFDNQCICEHCWWSRKSILFYLCRNEKVCTERAKDATIGGWIPVSRDHTCSEFALAPPTRGMAEKCDDLKSHCEANPLIAIQLDTLWKRIKEILLVTARALAESKRLIYRGDDTFAEIDMIYARLKLDLIARMSMECAVWTRSNLEWRTDRERAEP